MRKCLGASGFRCVPAWNWFSISSPMPTGTVDSNAMTIDLGVGNSIPEGQTVVLMGRDGDEAVWADEIAALCNMGVHEVLASIRN